MQYDCVVMYTYADKDIGTFHDFKLPANPIPLLEKQQLITMKHLLWPIN